jgi:hypothetical protein
MDKEIRHRGHTNVIVFAFAAFKAFFESLEAERVVEGKPVKTLRGKVMKVLKQLHQEVWWITYAHRILKNVMKDRAKARLGHEEEQEYIKELQEAVEKNEKSERVGMLKEAVRLVVERNLEERVNIKKVTVGGRASAQNLLCPHLPTTIHQLTLKMS